MISSDMFSSDKPLDFHEIIIVIFPVGLFLLMFNTNCILRRLCKIAEIRLIFGN